MKISTLSNYLDDTLSQFAFYKVLTQIPDLVDGLTVTQRKIIWVLSKLGTGKKIKTAQTYSMVYSETNYLHGDASVYNTANNLAAEFKNALNVVQPHASFGVRTAPEAAGPRYTSMSFSEIASKIFDKTDMEIIEQEQRNEFEGQVIEPYFLLPTLPLGLINGNSGIGMGFSANILSRNPLKVLKLIKSILKKEKLSLEDITDTLTPWIPFFKGSVEKGENNKQWIFKGKIKYGSKRNTIIIEDAPFYSKSSFESKVLSPMKDQGLIKSWNESCKKNNFYFEIKVPNELMNKSEEELQKLFKLNISKTENITFIGRSENGKLELYEFNNILEYLKKWIDTRGKYYIKRKEYILNKMRSELKIYENRIKFIQAFVDNKLEIRNRKKSEIEKDLITLGLDKIDDDYNYLLNMQIYSLTQEKIQELSNKIQDIKNKIDELEKTEPRELWLRDLESVEPLIEKEVQNKS